MKKTLIYTLTAGVAAAAIRILQYIFIIGDDGYYACDSLTDTIMRHSYGALIIISVLVALGIYILGKRKELAADNIALSGGFCAVVCLLSAMLFIGEGGIYIGRWIESGKFELQGVLGVLAGISFGVLAVELFSDKITAAGKLFGLFPSVYFCAQAIFTFFNQIDSANRSNTKITMIALGMSALYMMIVTGSRAGAEIAQRRVKAISSLACVICASGAAELIFTASADMDIVHKIMPVEFLLITLLSFVTLVRTYKIAPYEKQEKTKEQPVAEPEEEEEKYPDLKEFEDVEKIAKSDAFGLDVYIDEIPEEKEE